MTPQGIFDTKPSIEPVAVAIARVPLHARQNKRATEVTAVLSRGRIHRRENAENIEVTLAGNAKRRRESWAVEKRVKRRKWEERSTKAREKERERERERGKER
jgi:hypothetical protein